MQKHQLDIHHPHITNYHFKENTQFKYQQYPYSDNRALQTNRTTPSLSFRVFSRITFTAKLRFISSHAGRGPNHATPRVTPETACYKSSTILQRNQRQTYRSFFFLEKLLMKVNHDFQGFRFFLFNRSNIPISTLTSYEAVSTIDVLTHLSTNLISFNDDKLLYEFIINSLHHSLLEAKLLPF